MNNKRIVILFGTGAVKDQEGVQTAEITNILRTTGFNCSDNKTRITEFIYQTILKNGYGASEINFETIISVIEEFIIHYSNGNIKSKTPSLSKIFLSQCCEDIMCNFSVEGERIRHGFKLQIPKGVNYKYQHLGAINNETPI